MLGEDPVTLGRSWSTTSLGLHGCNVRLGGSGGPMSSSRVASMKDALVSFAESLTATWALNIPGQQEDQLKSPTTTLLAKVGTVYGRTVATKTESVVTGLGGRPDIGLAVNGLLCGHIELKAPGTGARTSKFKGDNKKQWDKFKSLPNVVYTDGNEWALYRTGQLVGKVVRFAGDVTSDGRNAVSDDNVTQYSELIRNFLTWDPVVPDSPRGLAEELAPLCKYLRTDVLSSLAIPGSAMSILAEEWRRFLFGDADDFQFADAYAQTLTYAMLLARLEGVTDLRRDAADALDKGHGLLAQVLRVLAQPDARTEIEVPLDLLERTIAAVDPEAVSRHGDPWIYFYEDFLAAYDEKLRKNRGVYYTPAQVVGCQVNLVTDLLISKFGKPLGMADDDVTVLDPAVGTGAYPLAAFRRSLELVENAYGAGAVGARATKAAKNLHGFELLVGPYAVAHLRLSEQILSAGGELPADGAHIYLTDTLESPWEPEGQLSLDLLHRRLAEEHKRARKVKSSAPVLACIGNPPYYRQAISSDDVGVERQGGWVRFGDHGNDGILADFVNPAIEVGMGGHVKNLYNLYVYFWRWALWKVLESTDEPGIVSFITASSYLRGPGFVGMREAMRRAFDELWIIDLEGDNLGARKTENVFAIQNPVAIAVGVRYGTPKPDQPATVWYTRITGTRQEKLARLGDVKTFDDMAWQRCFGSWHEPFLPEQSGDYFAWPLLTDVFPWQHSGVQFKRTWPIAPDTHTLGRRWQTLTSAPDAKKADLFVIRPARNLDRAYSRVLGMDPENMPPTLPVLRNARPQDEPTTVRYGYRTLDRQFAFADSRLADRPRADLWRVHSDKQVYMTSLLTGVLGLGPAASITAYVPDLHHFRGSFGGKDVIPLWRDAAGTEANINPALVQKLSSLFSQEVTGEDIFAYCYAVLSSPSYVDQFSEELVLPGPRIPITKDVHLFTQAVEIGWQLISLQTFGERSAESGTRVSIPQGEARCVKAVPGDPAGYPDEVFYDRQSRVLHVGTGEFAPVAPEVWDFSVSGFEPVQSWVAYRLAEGAGRRSSSLDGIRPERWTAEMTEELLRVLWIVERTLQLQPKLIAMLDEIVNGETVGHEEMPKPAEILREPVPEVKHVAHVQGTFDE